jgi:hypothetical protein
MSATTNRINEIDEAAEDMLSITINAQLDRPVIQDEQYFDDTIYKLKKALVVCKTAFKTTKDAFEKEQQGNAHTQHNVEGLNAVNANWQSRSRAGNLYQPFHALDGSTVEAAKYKDVQDTNKARKKLKKALELTQKSTPHVSEARKYNSIQARNLPAIASALADLKKVVTVDVATLKMSEMSWLKFGSLYRRVGELETRVDEWKDSHGDLGVA